MQGDKNVTFAELPTKYTYMQNGMISQVVRHLSFHIRDIISETCSYIGFVTFFDNSNRGWYGGVLIHNPPPQKKKTPLTSPEKSPGYSRSVASQHLSKHPRTAWHCLTGEAMHDDPLEQKTTRSIRLSPMCSSACNFQLHILPWNMGKQHLETLF